MPHTERAPGGEPAADVELYTRGVVMENLRLHAGLGELRDDNARLAASVAALRDERDTLAASLAAAEERGAEMMKLCITLSQLHGATDRAGVLAALKEVVINVIGSEEFAILASDGADGVALLDAMGMDAQAPAPLAARITREVLETGRPFLSVEGEPDGMAACVPLRADGRVTGAIAIYRLLGHKPALEPFDHVLLDAVADGAGTALRTAQLHEAAAAGA
ncbi:MAG TPA: hypothetical protein VFH27_17085 [Longimicrobiaceae bacterium]|nr:hypothetical protein [Longimicrobiaceae bacterium]